MSTVVNVWRVSIPGTPYGKCSGFLLKTQTFQRLWPLEETTSVIETCTPLINHTWKMEKSSSSLLIFLIHSSVVSVDSTWKPTVTVLYFLFLTLCILLKTSTTTVHGECGWDSKNGSSRKDLQGDIQSCWKFLLVAREIQLDKFPSHAEVKDPFTPLKAQTSSWINRLLP